jgi:hypothetical protein
MIVDRHDYLEACAYIAKVNRIPTLELKVTDIDGDVINVSREVMEEYDFMGLNNWHIVDFIIAGEDNELN